MRTTFLPRVLSQRLRESTVSPSFEFWVLSYLELHSKPRLSVSS
jgi:hypothetical protein